MSDVLVKENWRYTSLAGLKKTQWKMRSTELTHDSLLFIDDGDNPPIRLVFVDGIFDESVSQVDRLPGSVSWHVTEQTCQPELVMGITDIAVADQAVKSKAALKLSDQAYCDTLIYIVSIVTEHAASCYVPIELDIQLGQAAMASIHVEMQSFSDESSFVHLANRVHLAQGASLKQSFIQKESSATQQWQQHTVHQAQGSNYKAFHCHVGADLARVDIQHHFDGEHARAEQAGFYFSRAKQQHQFYCQANHHQPNCQSKQHFKGIADDQSHDVFHTKVIVDKQAHGSHAIQSNQNLLLSSQAEVDTQPILEIYNDDVTCSHGASVGNLDKKALFYLRSRGIDLETATAMLTRSFAAELLQYIDDETVLAGVEQCLYEAMGYAMGIESDEL